MSKFFKNYFTLFAAAAVITAVVLMKMALPQEKPNKNVLVVGLQSGYPPFEFMDAKGKIIGFDVELGGMIAKKLGKQLVIKDMEFEGHILSLKQGKIDLIMSGMNITPSRLKEIDMVPYHGEAATFLSLIFWKEILQGIQSLEDLAHIHGASISVESGAITEEYLKKHPQIHAKSFQGALAPLMDVKFGKSLANLVEPDVANYLKEQHPEVKVIDIPLPKGEAILGFGIGVKKSQTQLLEQITAAIQELKASGELKALEVKWFKGGLQ